jgi:hypothetical protein
MRYGTPDHLAYKDRGRVEHGVKDDCLFVPLPVPPLEALSAVFVCASLARLRRISCTPAIPSAGACRRFLCVPSGYVTPARVFAL